MIKLLLAAAALALFAPETSGDQEDAAPNPVLGLAGAVIAPADLDAFLTDRMEARNIPGLSVAVINQGEVVYLRRTGLADVSSGRQVAADTLFEGASISKPLFAFFVMSFVERGELDLDRPLADYLPHPDLPADEKARAMTARHVLTHQTGLPNWRTDTADGVLRQAFAPGTGVEYSGEGFQYLAAVLAHLADTDEAGLEALFQARVAAPLGLRHTRFIAARDSLSTEAQPHRAGETLEHRDFGESFGAAYSVHSEAEDFARWLIALSRGEGLSADSYAEMLRLQDSPVPVAPEQAAQGLLGFALGFVVIDTPIGPLYGHDGNNQGFSSAFAIHPETGWGFVIFANANQVSVIGLELAGFLTPELVE